jgi:hypothetical protein
VSEACLGFVFDSGACRCQYIKCPGRGSRCGSGGPVRSSNEAELHPRGRLALERGGASPEGATSPRARRKLTRGGDRSSSEAEPHPRGRPALERGGASPEGATSPRARQKLTRGGDRSSSEAEPNPRGRPILERGGISPEGASSPRARQSFVGAVLCPSSEAEFRPRVAGTDCSGRLLGPPSPWAPAAGLSSFWACFVVVSSFCVLFF